MLLFDAMFDGMRYDPHMAMEDTGSTKVRGLPPVDFKTKVAF